MPRIDSKVSVRTKKGKTSSSTRPGVKLDSNEPNMKQRKNVMPEKLVNLEEASVGVACQAVTDEAEPSPPHPAAARILQLARRVRDLSADLQAHEDLREATAQPAEVARSPGPGAAEEHNSEKESSQVKLLMNKLQTANLRLLESRNQCQQLKQELKLAQKALASEVGDGTPSRRGRAQQILVLQQKLLELQDQLKGRQRGQNERRDGDGRAAAALRQLERDRRCKHEQACQQLESTAAQLEAARGREGACRARARTLEAELACSRGQLSSLLQRDRSHDRRLAELADQLSAVEKKLSEKQQEIQNLERSWQAEKQTLMQDIIKKNAKIEELQSYLVTKNISAETPREEARSSTDTLLGELKEDEIEVPRCHAVNIYSQDCGALSVAREAERARLLELVAVLNQRLDSQRQQVTQAEDSLREERYRSSKLEMKLERLEKERAKTFKVNSCRNNRAVVEKDAVSEDVKYRLELAQEEVLVLKTKLQCLQREKGEDLRVYQELLAQAQAPT